MLQKFFRVIPPYAILSHTWEREEVGFQDMKAPGSRAKEKAGYEKIRQNCRWRILLIAYLISFVVNMPLLYGEGKRAFFRLQEEIVKGSNEESIFAWNSPGTEPDLLLDYSAPTSNRGESHSFRGVGTHEAHGIFADTPLAFMECGDIMQCTAEDTSASPFSLTNIGVHIKLSTGWLWAGHPSSDTEGGGYYALL
jgi:hypothetical protein